MRFVWASEGDGKKIKPILEQFEQYCQPRKHVPIERFCFNRRCHKPGESYDQYRTSLRKLAEGCAFETITPEEILQGPSGVWDPGHQDKGTSTEGARPYPYVLMHFLRIGP